MSEPSMNVKQIGLLVNIENNLKELFDIVAVREETGYPRWLSCINSGEYLIEKHDPSKQYDFSILDPSFPISLHSQTYLLISNNIVYGSMSQMSSYDEEIYDAAIQSGVSLIDLTDFPNAIIGNIWNGTSFTSPN